MGSYGLLWAPVGSSVLLSPLCAPLMSYSFRSGPRSHIPFSRRLLWAFVTAFPRRDLSAPRLSSLSMPTRTHDLFQSTALAASFQFARLLYARSGLDVQPVVLHDPFCGSLLSHFDADFEPFFADRFTYLFQPATYVVPNARLIVFGLIPLTVSLPTAPPNKAARARRTRRVLVLAR